jgi:hypothetical protein
MPLHKTITGSLQVVEIMTNRTFNEVVGGDFTLHAGIAGSSQPWGDKRIGRHQMAPPPFHLNRCLV